MSNRKDNGSAMKETMMSKQINPSRLALAVGMLALASLSTGPAQAQNGQPVAPRASGGMQLEEQMNSYRADTSRYDSRSVELDSNRGLRDVSRNVEARITKINGPGMDDNKKYIDYLNERRGAKVTYVADITGKYGPGNFIRMQGERGEHQYKFFLPSDVRPNSRNGDTVFLQVAYANTIDVLPQGSGFEVSINGRPAAILQLTAFHIKDHTIYGIELPLDGRSVAPGADPIQLNYGEMNTISFKVLQTHRLECSIEATYDMWTELDLNRTFLEFNIDNPIENVTLADVDWLFGGVFARDEPVKVYHKMTVRNYVIEAGAEVAQGLALRNNNRVLTTEAAHVDTIPGFDLRNLDHMRNVLIGPRKTLRDTFPEYARYFGIDGEGPMLSIIEVDGADLGEQRRKQKAYILVATGDQDHEVAIAGRRLARPDPLPNEYNLKVNESDLGDLASQVPENPKIIQGGEEIKLSQLGYNTSPFGGLRDVTQVELQLPADFFVADDTMVDIDLVADWDPTVFGDPDEVAAYYAAKFGPEAAALRQTESRLNIFVNGRGVVQVDLGAEGVDGWTTDLPKTVSVPLRNFRPGRNIVEFEANIVRPPPSRKAGSRDEFEAVTDPGASQNTRLHYGACDPKERLNKPVFTLSDQTKIKMEAFPRLVQLPNLGMTSTAGFPYYYNATDATRDQYNQLQDLAGKPYDRLEAPKFNLLVPNRENDAKSPRWSDRLAASWNVVGRLAQVAGGPMRADGVENVSEVGQINGSTLAVAEVSELRDDVLNGAPYSPDALGQLSAVDYDVFDPEANDRGEQPSLERVTIAQESQIPDDERNRGFFNSVINLGAEAVGREDLLDNTVPISDKWDTNSLMVMQYESQAEMGQTITTITARDASLLRKGTETLIADPWWRRLNGKATTISILGPEHTANEIPISTDPANYYSLPQQFDMGNVQRLFSNWFSRNQAYWIGFTLVLLTITAAVTWGLVRITGQKEEGAEEA